MEKRRDIYGLRVVNINNTIGWNLDYIFIRSFRHLFRVFLHRSELTRISSYYNSYAYNSFSRDPLPFRESKIVERIEISSVEGNVAIARQDWRDQGLVNPIPSDSVLLKGSFIGCLTRLRSRDVCHLGLSLYKFIDIRERAVISPGYRD